MAKERVVIHISTSMDGWTEGWVMETKTVPALLACDPAVRLGLCVGSPMECRSWPLRKHPTSDGPP